MKPELQRLIDEVTPQLAELKRTMKRMEALAQQIGTTVAGLTAEDWEDRYLAEGLVELEQHANG